MHNLKKDCVKIVKETLMKKSHFHIHMHVSSVCVSWTTCSYSYLPLLIQKKLVQPVWICIIVTTTNIMKALHLKATAYTLSCVFTLCITAVLSNLGPFMSPG
jgi:hypothetical protein